VPIAILPDAGVPAEAMVRIVTAAVRRGRRAVVIELPGFNGTRAVLPDMRPQSVAAELERMLDLLRLPRVDLLAEGWAGLVARCLAARIEARVRSLVMLDTPIDILEGTFLDRVLDARSNPEGLLRALRSRGDGSPGDVGLRTALAAVDAPMLQAAYCAVPIEAVAASEGSGWKLTGFPEPAVPWTVLPGAAAIAPVEGDTSPQLSAEMILDQLGDPAAR
jgi:pimeloyl-ACP methyl ester carboxylesterase